MSERRPKNLAVQIFIKAVDVQQDSYPVGSVTGMVAPRSGWIPCDGRQVSEVQFPELFDVIGHTYCPRMIDERIPMPAWKVVLMLVGFRFKPQVRSVRNPKFIHGYFAVPDLRPDGWFSRASD